MTFVFVDNTSLDLTKAVEDTSQFWFGTSSNISEIQWDEGLQTYVTPPTNRVRLSTIVLLEWYELHGDFPSIPLIQPLPIDAS